MAKVKLTTGVRSVTKSRLVVFHHLVILDKKASDVYEQSVSFGTLIGDVHGTSITVTSHEETMTATAEPQTLKNRSERLNIFSTQNSYLYLSGRKHKMRRKTV
jgi:hypothetical protein